MADENAVTPKKHVGLLECTALYRIYVSSNLTVTGKDGSTVQTATPSNGASGTTPTTGAGQLDVVASGSDQILAYLGMSPDGKNKAVYLARIPQGSKIFQP